MPLITDIDKQVLMEYLRSIEKSARNVMEATNQGQARNALIDLQFYSKLIHMRTERMLHS